MQFIFLNLLQLSTWQVADILSTGFVIIILYNLEENDEYEFVRFTQFVRIVHVESYLLQLARGPTGRNRTRNRTIRTVNCRALRGMIVNPGPNGPTKTRGLTRQFLAGGQWAGRQSATKTAENNGVLFWIFDPRINSGGTSSCQLW